MADYITIDNRQYRVCHNYYAFSMFAELTGKKTLEEMSDITHMSPQDLITMMYCAIYNGEELDGRTLDITSPSKLGIMVDMPTMQLYVRLFAKQVSTGIKESQVQTGDGVKKKTSFWMKLRGKH